MRITGHDFHLFLTNWHASTISNGFEWVVAQTAREAGLYDGDQWKLEDESTYEIEALGHIRCVDIPRLRIDTPAIALGWLKWLGRRSNDAPLVAPPAADEPVPAPAASRPKAPRIVKAVHDFVLQFPDGCRGSHILDHLQSSEGVENRKTAQKAVSKAREMKFIRARADRLWVAA